MSNVHVIGGETSVPSRRLVKVKTGVKGFLEGRRYVTPADPPFAVSDYRAAELVRAGLVVPVVAVPELVERAVSPVPARAEKAVKRA